MSLLLRLRQSPSLALTVEQIDPLGLREKSIEEIEQLPVFHGNERLPLAEWFEITGNPQSERIVIEGDCSRVHRLAAGMLGGELIAEGDVGRHFAAEMKAGEVELRGNAGDFCAAQMHGGTLIARQNVGHYTAAAYPGSRRGMRGGEIIIHGSAGNHLAQTMRRGTIVVCGETGRAAGFDMIAGSLFLLGSVGTEVGAEMRRGTIALFQKELPSLLPTFLPACEIELPFMGYYLKTLQKRFSIPALHLTSRYQRFCGDLATLGKGEILHCIESF
ncbi:Formylmethanofuran dehydrogenase subunit C [Planctomycetales bacterium 10988]|nr:Formylmethanofuran dehydrogenase subunit C [Planctomycetales bacterium 10988]